MTKASERKMNQIIYNMIGVLIICILAVFYCYVVALGSRYDRTKMIMILAAWPFAIIGIVTLNELLTLLR